MLPFTLLYGLEEEVSWEEGGLNGASLCCKKQEESYLSWKKRLGVGGKEKAVGWWAECLDVWYVDEK